MSGRYFAVMGRMPNGSEFCYGVSSTRMAATVMKRHADTCDNRFFATFRVQPVAREHLRKVLGL